MNYTLNIRVLLYWVAGRKWHKCISCYTKHIRGKFGLGAKADGTQALDLQKDALIQAGVDFQQIYEDYIRFESKMLY